MPCMHVVVSNNKSKTSEERSAICMEDLSVGQTSNFSWVGPREHTAQWCLWIPTCSSFSGFFYPLYGPVHTNTILKNSVFDYPKTESSASTLAFSHRFRPSTQVAEKRWSKDVLLSQGSARTFFSVRYACSNSASDAVDACIMSCDVSVFEKLRFCRPH